ncbi:hypothetical protein RHMOL_Rhmol10G0084600 [Rhododendron molle]|uniref:Uncharacterized protein n=1 Tax=Rhododendron molle TaxID=49168 RepID=A0ACC0M0K0_RHOML|nr:hypothetical protein RHMOL_Rhmol10G0084600 [Rhododendron molle]
MCQVGIVMKLQVISSSFFERGLFGVMVDGGGGWPSGPDCLGFHSRRLVPAVGLYIWERSAWLNGDVEVQWFVRRWLPV